VRSRGWRPDCDPERQRAAAETRSTMQPARGRGSSCAQRPHGFIPAHAPETPQRDTVSARAGGARTELQAAGC
ncbi:hypothetical protein DVA81_18545, partial [Acinetobacter baumannii]